MPSDKEIREELDTIARMLRIYCRGRHGGRALCPSCAELLAYAELRLSKCPHDPKPACKDCPTHCYSPEKRGLMREVMRYAGPRMPLRHPLLTLKHYLKKPPRLK